MDEGDTAYVRAVLVNQLRIGRACTPFEVIKVKTNSGYYPVHPRKPERYQSQGQYKGPGNYGGHLTQIQGPNPKSHRKGKQKGRMGP